MADLNNLPERGVPGTHLSVRHSPDAVAALRASIARQNLTIDVDATTGDVVLYLSAAKTTYITFSAATGATKLVVAGVDRGSIESGLMDDKDPQESVLSRYDPTPNLPVTPTEGDRYLATATANTWTKDYIYTLNSASAWDEYVPDEGALVEVEDENVWYTFTGAAWIRFEEQIAHALLAGLQGGTTSEYFHLTETQHAAFYLGQTGVLGRFDPTAALPVAPSDWDAYLATATANGWTDGNCYVWNGAAWIVVVVAEGQKLWVADEDLIYAYDGATWGILQAKDAGGHDHGGASGAGASHTHAITDPNHDHGAASGAGGAHTHVFTGTALPTTTGKVDDNAGSPGGNPLYVTGILGMFGGFNANNAVSGTPMEWELADGSMTQVLHNGSPAGFAVYFDKDLADGERWNANIARDGKDIYVPTTTGLLVKVVHKGSPTGIAVAFDDGAVADVNRMNADFTGAGDAGDKTCSTDDERTQYGQVAAGTNATEAVHTHPIAADATGVTADAEATHTHPITADATGVTADAEATHTHSITAAGDHAHDVGV